MSKISNAEKLARAVLIFHSADRWRQSSIEEWALCVGAEEATTKALCDLARIVRSEEELKNSG